MVSLALGSLSDTIVLVNLFVTCLIGLIVINESITIGKGKKEISKINKETSENNKEISNNNKKTSENDKVISNNNKEISIKELELKNKALEFQNTELDFKKKEFEFKKETLEKIKASTKEISKEISDSLIDNPTWLDRFMDETGVTYGGSIFGTRINHFFYEKKALAKKTIDILQEELINNTEMKCCLLIDSGTTTYHLFCEICERVKNLDNLGEKTNSWTDRIFIVTNNLPGVQYLIKHCRKGSDEYSDLLVKCLLLPGKPLPVYAAVAGSETIHFLEEDHIRERIRKELNAENDTEYQIICLMSANYMVRHPEKINGKELYCPVARGGEEGGHHDIKKAFVELSDKIYLISPLTKFSFATCKCLNKINGFFINEGDDPENARAFPDKVKYREIQLTTEKLIEKCNFILTDRKDKDIFWEFAQEFRKILKQSYGESKVNIADYDVEQWIPIGMDKPDYKDIEMKREIPHENLRNAYLKKKKDDRHFIWSYSWVFREEEECSEIPK